MTFVIESEKELGDIVWQKIKNKLDGKFVVGLVGDLGAGKTTLVKEIARHLGVKDHVVSPTFNIRKSYELSSNTCKANYLQHIDLYRVSDPKQADIKEIEEWLSEEKCVTFIEWPQYLPDFKKFMDLVIEIKPQGKASRKLEFLWT